MIKSVKTKEKKNKLTPLSIVLLVVLVVYCVTLLLLLLWAFITAFKVNDIVFDYDRFGFPNYSAYKALLESSSGFEQRVAKSIILADLDGGALFYSFRNIWKYFSITIPATMNSATKTVNMLEMYLYSFLYSLGCAATSTLIPCITAYLCARYKYKFSNVVRNIVIVVMIIPIIGSMPSEISLAQKLGLLDTVWGLWVMKANFLGLYFLVFYELFRSLPAAFTEAAKIDGAGNMQILLKIGLPLARNMIATVFLIRFVEFWNDYQTPLIFMSSYPTVARGLNELMVKNSETSGTTFDPRSIPAKMAAVVMTAVPILVVFMAFQKRLMSNLTMGGVKG